MKLSGLIEATLKYRYKRFLADVVMADGSEVTVHCANPGSMMGVAEPGSKVFLVDALKANPKSKRKLRYTWTMVEVDSGVLVVVDTGFANKFVKGLVEDSLLPELNGYRKVFSEPKYMDGRFDLLLKGQSEAVESSEPTKEAEPGDCFVEIKSTTYREDELALFPDAKTERGRKHLYRLGQANGGGIRAVQFFLVNRADTDSFAPALKVDPEYARALTESAKIGVEVIAYDIKINLNYETGLKTFEALVEPGKKLPVLF